ncbi:MAG: PGPGW domain-containing protein [Sporichthyaceae bacterium]
MSRSHDKPEIPAEEASPEELVRVAAIIAGEQDEHLERPPAGTRESAAVAEARKRRRTILLLRKIGITLLGGLITLAGIAMIPLPGPGWLVVVLGLWVLSKEYEWADRLLDKIRDKVIDAAHAAAGNRWSTTLSVISALAMIVGGLYWASNEDLPFSSWTSGGFLAGGGVLALATIAWSVQDLKKKRARTATR